MGSNAGLQQTTLSDAMNRQEAVNRWPRHVGPDGKYQLRKLLNTGSSGNVWLAYDLTKGQHVAIKAINIGRTNSRYVEREILNHRTLCHPHIITFREVFTTESSLCIAMEYAQGGDLYEYILKRKCLHENLARWYFQQLCIAVDYCHRRRIVIRDIKLDNLLLDKSQNLLKICDFGFSKGRLDSIPKTCLGTPAYLAPEVLISPPRKKCYDGRKVDIWTCGVCLFVMLYGYYPFDNPYEVSGNRTKRMLQKIVQGKLDIPKYQRRQTATGNRRPVAITEDCRDFLRMILQPNPKHRIDMEGIFQNPWFQRHLPPGALQCNSELSSHKGTVIERARGLQSEAEIRAIVREAGGPQSGELINK